MKFQLFLASLSSQLKPRHWWLSLLLWLVLVAPARASSLILRVSVERGVSQVVVGSSTKAIIKDGTGRQLGEMAALNSFSVQPRAGGVALDRWESGAFWVEPTAGGYVYIGDRWYRGKVLVVPTQKGLTAVNYIDLEQYLYSVVGAEVFSNWPLEALKAQAVAARTYALYKRQNAGNSTYDLGDTPYWQAYRGVESEASTTRKAVDTTAGQVLTYKGQIIESSFHNCAGGHTDNVEDVWGSYLPYLRGVRSPDENVRECKWVRTFSPDEISKRISSVGRVEQLKPTLTAYGSIKSVTIIGKKGTREMRGEAFKDALGLKSQRFTMSVIPTGLRLDGLGWGHGVGMSQWGAHHMAQRNYNYLQILGHYYKNTYLAKIQVR